MLDSLWQPRIALQGIALGIFLIFVARPIAVWLCLLPFRFPRAETAFVSWVGVRGAGHPGRIAG